MNLRNIFSGGKSDEPMNEEAFWALIERNKGRADKITKELVKLGPERTKEFSDIYWAKHRALHSWDVWGAGYVINGGCSDDSFHYFKAWLIGRGRKVYETPLDELGQYVSERDLDEGCENESLNYAAIEAYEILTGQAIEYHSNEGEEPSGTAWEEETDDLAKLFPKLTAKFD